MDELVSLGKTDVKINPLGTGAWAWGDSMVWEFGKGHGASDVKTAFDATLASGVTFFDTAEVYGLGTSEKLLGQFAKLSKTPVVIATKFFPYPWRFMRSQFLNALRASLKRLDVERVELYQIHWPFSVIARETWVDALGEAVQLGLTRAAGISNFNAEQTRRAHEALAKRNVPLASNQLKYSLLDRHIERDGTMQACKELGVTVIAYSPIEMGLLSGKYTPSKPPSGNRSMRYRPEYLAAIQPVIGLLREIGQAHGGKTPSQVALNWTICKGTVPIPGAKNAKQAQENMGALGWRLNKDEIAAVEKASESAQRK